MIGFLPRIPATGEVDAFALLPASLYLPEVFRPALGNLLPTLPSKFDGGGIFRVCDNSKEVRFSSQRIMDDGKKSTNALKLLPVL